MNTLKGVNKQIVEINYTKNDYVEKAILIINPEKKYLGESIIKNKAQGYLDTLQLPVEKRRKANFLQILKASMLVLLGACIMALIVLIL